jgi:hypothetical protein
LIPAVRDFVIEETADPGGAHADGLSFKIEAVPHAALPEEMAVGHEKWRSIEVH